MGLVLHPTYGVNPSISQCYFCLEDLDVILFGNSWRDKDGNRGQAPMKCGVINMQPCPKCEEHMKQGIIVISIRDDDSGPPPREVDQFGRNITPLWNPCRTGGWWLVNAERLAEIIRGIMKDKEHGDRVAANMLQRRWIFLPDKVCDMIGFVKGSTEPAATPETPETPAPDQPTP